MTGPTPDRSGTGGAPGKVILFGEHAVVYGRPAVACALGLGLGATAVTDESGPLLDIPAWGQKVRLGQRGKGLFESLERGFAAALEAVGLDPARTPVALTLDGALPPGVGLGSSAAFAVALIRALWAWQGHKPGTEALLKAAESVEAVFHGTPSGIDHTVATLGGCLKFRRGAAQPFEPVPVPRPIPVVVAWTPREAGTREAVSRLRTRAEALPRHYDQLFDAIAEVTEAGCAALATGDRPTLGALFNLNQGYLNACGVSNLANERMVALARSAGALGAKLTGAGLGGATLALPEDDGAPLVAAFEAEGFRAFATSLCGAV